ncbi:MAG: LPP20 family lipoprotein [Balneolales bacterium]
MQTYRTVLLLALLTLMASCASPDATRESTAWLTDPYSAYHQNLYLLAVGSGSTLQEAQNSASANMARIFSSQVSSDQTLRSQYMDYQNNDAYFSESTSDLLNITNVSSHQQLLNTRVLNTHQDDSQHYVLLGINRTETSLLIGSEISSNDANIRSLNSIINGTDSKTEQLSRINQASMLMEVNRNLIAQYDILSSFAYSDAADYNSMERNFEQIKKGIHFSVSGEEQAARSVISSLNSSGYTVSGEYADFEVFVAVDQHEAHLNRDDAVFMNWNVNIIITNLYDNDVNTYEAKGRSGTLSESLLQARVYDDINDEIRKTFSTFLTSQLFSQN